MKLKSKKIKNLSNSNNLPGQATPAVGGGVVTSCGAASCVDCGDQQFTILRQVN